MKDHYEVLGVAVDATPDEVKRAWRAAQQRWHPDRCAEAQAARRLVEAGDAWRVLGDPQTRARYDLERVAASPAELHATAQGVARQHFGRDLTERERMGVNWLAVAVRLARAGKAGTR